MGAFRGFHIASFHRGALALALTLSVAGCGGLWKDEQPSLLEPAVQSEGQTAPAQPVPVVEGLVVASAAGGAPACSVARLAGTPGGTLTEEEAQAAFACLSSGLAGSYGGSPHLLTRQFTGWTRMDRTPFEVAALDNRYAAVYANERALSLDTENLHRDRDYDVGATLAVVTFSVEADGVLALGPLVFVEKMPPGYTPLKGNWRYTFISPQGDVEAVTNGRNADDITLCAECTHEDADLLYLSLLNNGQIPL